MKEDFVDYAKGFSILTIVLFHFLLSFNLPQPLAYAINFGGAGVHLFFFLSGYGLTKSKFTGYKSFLKRRMIKVLLPYYIAITVIYIINYFTRNYPHGLNAYLSHIFLYKMFSAKYDTSFGEHFWFISTIIQFYLVFPVLLFVLKSGRPGLFLAISFLISITYSIGISLSPYAGERVVNSFFVQYLWEFVLGMVVAHSNKLTTLLAKPLYNYLILAPICLFISALLAIRGEEIGKNFNDLFSFIAYFSVVVIVYKTCKQFYPIANRFFTWISFFSYSIYLIHIFLFNLFKVENYFTLILILSFVILISYGYNLLVVRLTKYVSHLFSLVGWNRRLMFEGSKAQ